MNKPLLPLQRAYLLGRSTHLPLGGVAMQKFCEFHGKMQLQELKKRIHRLVEKHDSLRTCIDNRELVSVVSEEVRSNFDIVSLEHLTRDAALAHIDAQREDFAHQLCDLEKSPWQIRAFKLRDETEAANADGPDNLILFARFDALILDGRSIAALMVELLDGAMVSASKDEPQVSEPLNLTVDPCEQKKAQVYWQEKLHDIETTAELPWRRPLESIPSSRYKRKKLTIEKAVFRKFLRLGAKQGLFKNSALTAVILEVLSVWIKKGDLCVGLPVATEAQARFENNSSFIMARWPRKGGDFSERAMNLQNDVLNGLQHQSFSGVALNRLIMNKTSSQVPLPVVVTNTLSWPVLSDASSFRQVDGLTQTPQVAVDIRLAQDEQGNLSIDVDFAVEAIEESLIDTFLKTLRNAVETICERATFDLDTNEIIDLKHYQFNSQKSSLVRSDFLRRIADNLWSRDTAKTALIQGERRLSYAALGYCTGKAMASLKERGLGKGNVVAVCLPRSAEHTAICLACAFLGITWVPIDASAPAERLEYLLGNCHADLVVTTISVNGYNLISAEALMAVEAPAYPESLLLPLDELSSSLEPAYYLYTSGTTGKPKCVVLNNRATSNTIGSTLANWQVTSEDTFISVTPLHHDMSVFDVFGCLTAGATLVLPEAGEEKDAIRWNQLVKEHQVTVWCSVPAILEMLLSCHQATQLSSLRLIAQGGDYIKPSVIAGLRELNPNLRLISLGGPTETTIWSIWHEIQPDDVSIIPYGRPLPANQYFLLNDRGEHCPAHAVGRIFTAGVNVALGYLEEGELKQTDFVTIQDENGNDLRAFRTGDRGRYRPDGTILFDSRVNSYVKVRGVRVSLPDIEGELARHPGIARLMTATFGAEKLGETSVGVIYVPRSGESVAPAELRQFARQHMPESHLPSRFVKVADLPLSANGKPDRNKARQLLEEGRVSSILQKDVEPACISKVKRILKIYYEAVGINYQNGTDSKTEFISIGVLPSHLKKVAGLLNEEFGVRLQPAQLLKCKNAMQVELLLTT